MHMHVTVHILLTQKCTCLVARASASSSVDSIECTVGTWAASCQPFQASISDASVLPFWACIW